jgi:hypothetical protein
VIFLAGLTGEESFDLEGGRGASGGLVIVYKRTLAFRLGVRFYFPLTINLNHKRRRNHLSEVKGEERKAYL